MDTALEVEVGDLLRYWRGLRRKSQLELSFDTGISQKHLSFIESGRSVPGRQVLMCVAEALEVPLRERNALLLAAGYAPQYSEAPLDGPDLSALQKAMQRMLRQHEPFPALALDRHWNVLFTNESAPRFFGRFVDLSAWPKPRNLLRLMFDPFGLRPHIANWEQLAPSLIQRLLRESVAGVIDTQTRCLLDTLMAFPGVKAEWQYPSRSAGATPVDHPVIPVSLRWPGDPAREPLNYFSLITTVGTPQAVSGQELRIESMFPADQETETGHESLLVP